MKSSMQTYVFLTGGRKYLWLAGQIDKNLCCKKTTKITTTKSKQKKTKYLSGKSFIVLVILFDVLKVYGIGHYGNRNM